MNISLKAHGVIASLMISNDIIKMLEHYYINSKQKYLPSKIKASSESKISSGNIVKDQSIIHMKNIYAV
jgi:hypothetical protein